MKEALYFLRINLKIKRECGQNVTAGERGRHPSGPGLE